MLDSPFRDLALDQVGCECGMRALKQDGIEKCLAGLTDLHEVRATAS